MVEAVAFTAAEAAFVLREPVKAIKKAFDEGPVRTRLVVKPGGSVRAIEWSDLFYLYAVRVLRDELTAKGRSAFYHALKAVEVEHAREVTFGRVSVAIDDLRAEVEARSRELAALAGKVDFRADGEPLLRGAPVEVYRIAALLAGGSSVDEVIEDYPSLSAAEVETARAYAEAHPKVGRPYPRTTAKRALKGAGLEALDEFLEAEPA